jgi:acyl carrier protein
MDREEAFEKFRTIAAGILEIDAEKITPEARWAEDLDADSLDLTELVMNLEDEFGIEVDDSELEGIETVGQAFDLVMKKIS